MPKAYAGLDVSDQTTAICILDKTGNPTFESSVPTIPAAIAAALKPYRRSLASVALESGTKSVWLYKELTKSKFPMVCLDARHARAALSANPNKTDQSDARGLATLVARGIYTTAYIKSDESIRLRTLLLMRKSMQRKALDMRGSVRASLKALGAHIEQADGRFAVLRGEDEHFDAALTDVFQTVLRSSQALLAEVARIDRLVEQLADDDPISARLMTVPGVGPITALTFRAAVDDPRRFKSSRVVAASFGLAPKRLQSGQMDILKGISRCGDTSTRTALYAAARILMTNSRSTCRLRLWALRLAKKKGMRLATTACARKLAVVMHRMWVTGTDFEPQL